MGYLLAATPVDQLLLRIAAEDGETRPRPWSTEDLNHLSDYDRKIVEGARAHRPPTQASGFCFLNKTDALWELYHGGYFYESAFQGFVIHLTWKGWDRVEELLAAGQRLPTKEEMSVYDQRARVVVEGGDHGDYIPLDVPNPKGFEPVQDNQVVAGFWRRFFSRRKVA